MRHLLGLFFSFSAFILLLIANLGLKFDSTFLPNVYLVSLSQSSTHQSVRYGLYSSCIYGETGRIGCTQAVAGYSMDLKQIVAINNGSFSFSAEDGEAFGKQLNSINQQQRSGNILILLATILNFLAMLVGVMIRKTGDDTTAPKFTFPILGAGLALGTFIFSGIGMILVIYSHQKLSDTAVRMVEGMSSTWGPTVYLIGIGCLLSLSAFVSYTVVYLERKRQLADLEAYDYYQPNKFYSGRQYY